MDRVLQLFIITALLILHTVGQDFGNLPTCGQQCAAEKLGMARGMYRCAEKDIRCVCGTGGFEKNLRDCVSKSCNADDVDVMVRWGASYCAGNMGAGSSSKSSLSTQISSSTTSIPKTSSLMDPGLTSFTLDTLAATSSSTITNSPVTPADLPSSTQEKLSRAFPSDPYSPSATPPSPSMTKGLSSNTKIGIGVGIPCTFLIVGLIGACILWKDRKGSYVEPLPRGEEKGLTEKHCPENYAQELDGRQVQIAELETQGNTPELAEKS